jgi:hypothetical protein
METSIRPRYLLDQKEWDVIHAALTRTVENLDGQVMDHDGVEFVDACKKLLGKFE